MKRQTGLTPLLQRVDLQLNSKVKELSGESLTHSEQTQNMTKKLDLFLMLWRIGY